MSFLYECAKQLMLGRTSLGTETFANLTLSSSVNAALIKSSYTPDNVASTTTSWRLPFANRALDLTAGHVSQSNDIVLTGMEVSSSAGITFFNAGNAAFSVSTGQVIHGILIYQAVGGLDSTSIPIAFINVATVTANGATINVNWDTGVNRIFALTG